LLYELGARGTQTRKLTRGEANFAVTPPEVASRTSPNHWTALAALRKRACHASDLVLPLDMCR
jgi:hypothetical protein